jgi:putative N6-adenine-specific DNA methylase
MQLQISSGQKPVKDPGLIPNDPDMRFNLHISDDKCTILLDSSGESLHKRGYRTETSSAPLNEVMAAGMILLSGWDRKSDLLIPCVVPVPLL